MIGDSFIALWAAIWDLPPFERHRVIAEWDRAHGHPHEPDCMHCRPPIQYVPDASTDPKESG